MAKVKATAIEILRPGKVELSDSQVQKFFEETPKEKIRKRPAKGGGEWSYVAGSYAKQVLNRLFGFKWTFEVDTNLSDAFAVAQITRQAVVKGTLKVKVGDDWISKTQWGRADIKFRKDEQNKPLDFGNDLKAATTDCLKKCCNELGLFMDVYSQEDFMEAEIVPGELEDAEEAVRLKIEAQNDKAKN